jgi:hypothetical protein
MRAALPLALLFLLSGVPSPGSASSPLGPGDGPLDLVFHITQDGVPLEGSVWASQPADDGVYRIMEADLDGGEATLHAWPGGIHLNLVGAEPERPSLGFGDFDVESAMDLPVDLAARDATVPLDVRVTDSGTGALLPGGAVMAQMLFGVPLCIGEKSATGAPPLSGQPSSSPPPEPCDLQMEEPGHLVGRVPPGVILLRGDTDRYAPCLVGYTTEGQPPCEIHAPRQTAVATGEGVDLDLPLRPVPPPDADVEGYLVSGVTGEAVPRKSIQFHGTGDFSTVFFSAYLDEDGSYRLRVPAGDYVASASLCGHDPLRVTFTATRDSVLRLDFTLPAPAPVEEGTWTSGTVTMGRTYAGPTGGPVPWPECDARMSPSATMTGQPPEGQPADAEPAAAAPPEPEPVRPTLVGLVAIADFGGGLGPLHGAAENDAATSASLEQAPESPKPSPAAPWEVAALALAALALALRRRLA